MTEHVHFHFHLDLPPEWSLWRERVDKGLALILHEVKTMQTAVEHLESVVDGLETVVEGVVTVIDTLVADVRQHIGDPVRIEAALAKAEAFKQPIAEAVARGTAADAEANPPTA